MKSHLSPTRERGFTLPELLVAMVITTVVTGGALAALQQANQAAEIGSVRTDLNQNLRVAMNMVIKDLLQAGEGTRTGISIPSGVGSQPIPRPGPEGADWDFDHEFTVLPAVAPGDDIGTVVNDVSTDVISVMFEDHRLDLNPGGIPLPVVAVDGSSVTFNAAVDVSNAVDGIKVGDLIRFGSDGAMQEVTSVSGQTAYFNATCPSNLNQRTAPAGSVMEKSASFGGLDMHRIYLVSYYIYIPSTGAVTSPHLIRRLGWGTGRVVATGLENMQLTFDLVDGVTNPTNQNDFTGENEEGQIRKANLFMAARSFSFFSRTNQYQRTSLSTQVSLRSMAFVSNYNLQ